MSLAQGFNLYFNSVCSFWAGIIAVWIVIKLFRVGNSRWKQFLLSLPFLKIIWDLLYRGVPSSSAIVAGVDPLTFPPKSQLLMIGAGFSEFGPYLNAIFAAEDPSGHRYTTSVADYFFFLMSKHFGVFLPGVLLMTFLGVSVVLLGLRFYRWTRFELTRRQNRINDSLYRETLCGRRRVDIYVSQHYEGTPFTGGVFRPYICIPHSTFQTLSSDELEAVIQHELGHIRHWDLLGTLAIQSLGDLFWFIPGYRWLAKRVDRLREILADEVAKSRGAIPLSLASALIKVQAMAHNGGPVLPLYSAFYREKKLLTFRVERLIGEAHEPSARLGWQNPWVRAFVIFWTVGGVILTTFGGNYEHSDQAVPIWVERLLNQVGQFFQ